MRTNIDIDEKALAELIALTGASSKKEAVNQAVADRLRQLKAAAAIRSLYGKLEWEGDLDAMRRAE